MNEFLFEPFLLGVWHFVFCERNENNKDGVQTIEAWESERNSGSKAGSMSHETIENRLGRSIQVKSILSEIKNDSNSICPELPKAAEPNASSETAVVQVRQKHKMFVYEEPLDKEAESLLKKLKEDININNFLKACILGTADISKPSNYKDHYHYFQKALGMINLRIYILKSSIKDIDSLFYDDVKNLEGTLNLFVNKRIKPDCRDGHPNYSSDAVADIETCKKEFKDIYEALYGNLTTIKDFNLMLFLKLW